MYSYYSIPYYYAHVFRWTMCTHAFPGWLLLNAHQKLKVLARHCYLNKLDPTTKPWTTSSAVLLMLWWRFVEQTAVYYSTHCSLCHWKGYCVTRSLGTSLLYKLLLKTWYLPQQPRTCTLARTIIQVTQCSPGHTKHGNNQNTHNETNVFTGRTEQKRNENRTKRKR